MNEGQRNTGPPIRIQFCGVAMVMVQLEKDMSGLKKNKKNKKEEKRRRSIYTSATTFEYLTVFTAHFIFRQTGYSYVITDWHLLST